MSHIDKWCYIKSDNEKEDELKEKREKFDEAYGTVLEGLKKQIGGAALAYQLIFLTRRILMVALCIMLHDDLRSF